MMASEGTTNILVVEDERDLARTLQYSLEREGYDARVAFSGAEALQSIKREPKPDLVLLDVMLPDLSGTEVCREIRAQPGLKSVPVIMVTAKGEEIDRVVGFEVGADDYVVKPFSVRELLLRVRAVLRRAQSSPEEEESDEEIVFAELRIDQAAHRVFVDEEEVSLTPLEFRLLTTFLERKGRVQTRDVLLSDVWGIHADVTTRTVDTHVKRLRQKLGEAGSYIETLRGVGYRFCASPDQISDS